MLIISVTERDEDDITVNLEEIENDQFENDLFSSSE